MGIIGLAYLPCFSLAVPPLPSFQSQLFHQCPLWEAGSKSSPWQRCPDSPSLNFAVCQSPFPRHCVSNCDLLCQRTTHTPISLCYSIWLFGDLSACICTNTHKRNSNTHALKKKMLLCVVQIILLDVLGNPHLQLSLL